MGAKRNRMASVEVNSQPRQPPIFWDHFVSWIRSIPRAAILSMVGPSVLCMVGYFGWLYYGAHNLDMAYYGLKKENIHITDQPAWLKKTNVLDEVFAGSSLSRQSMLDSKTPGHLASVFDAHPSVRKTHRVQQMAGGVKIDLEYRIPVAMVGSQRGIKNGQPIYKYFAVDADAVLLDADNFTEDDVRRYITIYASSGAVDTNSKKGKPFGDPRIEEAARLCSFLSPIREAAKISRVQVYPSPHAGRTKWRLEILTTDSGPSFLWGSCPGMEGLGEPLADTKLKQLLAVLSDSKRWTKGMIDLSGSQTATTH